MTTEQPTFSWNAATRWLQVVLILSLCLGIGFRCLAVDRKVYSVDESFTALRVSGYLTQDLAQRLANGQAFPVEALQSFQRANPERGLGDTIRGLATEEPQHVPLYFGLARLWAAGGGGAIAPARWLSVCFSLLTLPGLYWLSRELFGPGLVSGVAIALYALSPVQVLYAQEARPYSLWVCTMVLASAALLQALRRDRWQSWALYAATVSLGLYSFLFSALVVLGHGLYLLGLPGRRRTIARYGLAVGGAILTFVPWLVAIAQNWSKLLLTTSSSRLQFPLEALVRSWLLNLSYGVIDFGQDVTSKNLLLHLLLFGLILTAFYRLIQETSRQVWLFVLTLVGCNALALIVPDLLEGGRRSSESRYLFAVYLGVLLALAYLLGTRLLTKSQPQQKVWQLLFVGLLWASVLSDGLILQATTWWNKLGSAYYAREVAQVINQGDRALLITESDDLLALSHQLQPGTLIQWVPQQPFQLADGSQRFVPQLPAAAGADYPIFLYQPTQKLGTELEQVHRLQVRDVQTWQRELNPTTPVRISLLKLEKVAGRG